MPVIKITGQGLSAMALSVALLWAILLRERSVVSISEARRIQALQQIRQLRRQFHPEPVRVPRLPGRVAGRTSLG